MTNDQYVDLICKVDATLRTITAGNLADDLSVRVSLVCIAMERSVKAGVNLDDAMKLLVEQVRKAATPE